jgi:hypothetical protein
MTQADTNTGDGEPGYYALFRGAVRDECKQV